MFWFVATFLLMKSRDKLVKSNVPGRFEGLPFERHASENNRRARFPSGPDNSGGSQSECSNANACSKKSPEQLCMDRSFLCGNPVHNRFTELFTPLLIALKH